MYPARGRGTVRVHVSVGTLAGNVSFNVPIIYLLIRQKKRKKKKPTPVNSPARGNSRGVTIGNEWTARTENRTKNVPFEQEN